ncbi:MAG TPA: hypothetical protein VFO63_21130 [Blastocatellia bacterium]|nr:hypothetical protein [Blastocatellia bacterium]
MKICPHCREQFEDELKFCTFDGAVLRPQAARQTAVPGAARYKTQAAARIPTYNVAEPDYATPERRNGWKTAFFFLLAINLIAGVALAAYLLMKPQPKQDETPVAAPSLQPTAPENVTPAEEVEAPKLPSEMAREELMKILPRNLLRRFHAGEQSQGTPDDLRVIKDETGEHVVLLGAGRLDGPSRTPAGRILILKYEANDFKDVTRQALPAAYASGAVAGEQADVKFDETGVNLLIHEPASLKTIVAECAQCEHAYQQVKLEWKGARYGESSRAWENDRYTAFYVVAEALERRRVDARARPFIDKSLDPIIAEGFARNGKDGWTVEAQSETQADNAAYELNNGDERLLIRLTRVNGQWKAVHIDDGF